jgi:uncharacterized caspase-like protein
LLALVSLCVLTFSEAQAAVEKRIALVIGNSAYKNVSRLANPASDSTAMAALLQRSGFEVVLHRQDLSIADMRRALRDFGDKARDADIAVVFYAGHGIEVDGTNYLLPVDTVLERDSDVEDEGVSLDRIVKLLEPVRRLRLVILDACRDNPFGRTMKRTLASRSIGRGLGKVDVQMSDTLVAFAAKAGSTASDGDGNNSPFTTALLNNIATPGLDLRLAFGRVRDEVLKITSSKQEPFVYGSLGGSTVALVPPPAAPVIAAPAPAPAPVINPQAEMRRDYEFAGQIGTKEAWEQFLSVYKTGFYAGLARAAHAKIVAEEAKAAADAKARAEAAVKAAATKAEADAKAAAAKAEAEARAAAKAEADAKAAAAKQANIVVAAVTSVAPEERAKPAADPAETIKQMQSELRRLGCYSGVVNGDWNSDSRRALETFNKHAGMRLEVKVASIDALDVVRGKTTRICPLECDRGYKAQGETCIKITCPSGQFLNDGGTCQERDKPRSASRPEPSRPAADKAAEPRKSGGGQIVCGRAGCQEVKPGCRAVSPGGSAAHMNGNEIILCN